MVKNRFRRYVTSFSVEASHFSGSYQRSYSSYRLCLPSPKGIPERKVEQYLQCNARELVRCQQELQNLGSQIKSNTQSVDIAFSPLLFVVYLLSGVLIGALLALYSLVH